MKNQSLLAYALIALAVYILRRPTGCSGTGDQSKKATNVIYVPKADTITRYVSGETIIRTIIRHDTIQDRVVIRDFSEVDTAVLIMYAERGDSVRLFEGTAMGEDGKCGYKYLMGIHADSLQFLVVETDCNQEAKNIIIESPLGHRSAPWPGTRFMVGGKMGMTPDNQHKTYGVQAAYGGLYAAVNYVPAIRKPVLEAGLMFPIGKKKNTIFGPDTLIIEYR